MCPPKHALTHPLKEPVCAVVVTFRPNTEAVENLAATRSQVQAVIVVDNGSGPVTQQMLRRACSGGGLALIENPANRGIAAALNQGIRRAEADGFEWVLLLDQDSTMEEGFVDAMFAEAASLAAKSGESRRRGRPREIAVYCPAYVDRSSGGPMGPFAVPGGHSRGGDSGGSDLTVARTSGSLIPLWVFRECGWFAEEMIIDQVDYEFCLRLRGRGYRIAQCAGARLVHSLGAPTVHRLLGRRIFGTTNHAAARRYYLVRNRIWLLKRYWSSRPLWCAGICIATLKESLKIFLVERDWDKKLRNTLLGLKDGVIGRMGMTVKL